MILNILDKDRNLIEIIRTFESCLWTRKYQDVGGCVLVIAPTDELVELFRTEAKYISRDDDRMVCEIKKINIQMDNSSYTYKMTITAIDAISVLNQRIVWDQLNYNDVAGEYALRAMVTTNVIVPALTNRKIDFVQMGTLKNFTEKITMQVQYEQLLDVIINVCKTYDYGFRFVFLSTKNLALEFYRGLDCSRSQTENSYVVFSKGFNNLLSFDWEIDYSGYKNVSLVAGEGEGTARKRVSVGSMAGASRFETYTDASSISSNQDNELIPEEEYMNMLREAGYNDLATKQTTQKFACKVDVEQYEYKVDYDLGYKVTVEADYGLTFDAKIVEIIECEDASGYRITANLEM